MYKEIIIIALLFSGLLVKAQIPNDQISTPTWAFQKELPKMVNNADVLLTGERLHYKMYNLTQSGTPSSLSKISYVSLRADNDSIVFSHKLKLQKGSAHGSFFIPASLKTGIYRLIGYTHFSLNNEENAVAHRRIYIVNPFIKSVTGVQKDSSRMKAVLKSGNVAKSVKDDPVANGISIVTDRPSYGKREKISMVVENLNGKFGYGNYVLSVRRLEPVEGPKLVLSKNVIKVEKGNAFYVPELRGELISGKVVTADNNTPMANKVVALSIPGQNYIFKTARTNARGRFFLSIEESYETANSLIQIFEPDRGLYKVVLDKKDFNLVEKEELPILKLDSNLEEWLEKRSVQLQIQNAYFKQDSIASPEGFVAPFYGSLVTEFVLDDYTRFNSLEETFVEVVTLARIRKKNGKDAFEVFDPFNPYKTGPFSSLDPLLLLDGVLIQDADEILALSANEIKSVKVFPNAYRYGPKIFRGIIDFKTKEGNYQSRLDGVHIEEFELIRPLSDRKYTYPNHSNESYKRLPDYRTQLFWKPNIDLTAKELKNEFYSSDVPGTYQIKLEGYTYDGKHIVVKHYFDVE